MEYYGEGFVFKNVVWFFNFVLDFYYFGSFENSFKFFFCEVLEVENIFFCKVNYYVYYCIELWSEFNNFFVGKGVWGVKGSWGRRKIIL